MERGHTGREPGTVVPLGHGQDSQALDELQEYLHTTPFPSTPACSRWVLLNWQWPKQHLTT